VDDRSESAPAAFGRRLWLIGGVVGLAAAIALVAGVEARSWRLASRPVVMSLIRWHDGLIILQSVLLVPFAVFLSRVTLLGAAPPRLVAASLAVTSLLAIALLQTLRFVNVGPDTLYMLPQGLLGVWAIMMSRRMRSRLSRAVLSLGVVAGIGLMMIAASLLSIILYFGVGALSGPIRNPGAYAQAVNRGAHYNLRVGTYLGRLGLPIWVLLIGRRALRL
jgi:hypothetical protein